MDLLASCWTVPQDLTIRYTWESLWKIVKQIFSSPPATIQIPQVWGQGSWEPAVNKLPAAAAGLRSTLQVVYARRPQDSWVYAVVYLRGEGFNFSKFSGTLASNVSPFRGDLGCDGQVLPRRVTIPYCVPPKHVSYNGVRWWWACPDNFVNLVCMSCIFVPGGSSRRKTLSSSQWAFCQFCPLCWTYFVVWASKPKLSTRDPLVSLCSARMKNLQLSLTPPYSLSGPSTYTVFFKDKIESKCYAKTKPSGFFKHVHFWGLVTNGGVRFCLFSETQRSSYRWPHGEIRSAQVWCKQVHLNSYLGFVTAWMAEKQCGVILPN